MDELDTDKALVAAAGTQMTELFSKQMDMLLAEHSAMGRWLTASLLAINGAGALAVFSAADKLSRPTFDGLPFVIGVLAALMSGVYNQAANSSGAGLLGAALGQSFVVAQTGEYTPEQQALADSLEPEMKKLGKAPVRAGWFSAIAFSVGALLSGSDGPMIEHAALARCEALQTDMLSAKPRRADSIKLFEALGCRPQGQGRVYATIGDRGSQGR